MREAAKVGTRVPVKRSSFTRGCLPFSKSRSEPQRQQHRLACPPSPGGRPWSLLLPESNCHGTFFQVCLLTGYLLAVP